jgi:hypothetical protein
MDSLPPTTTFTSRGRLSGVLRQRPTAHETRQADRAAQAATEHPAEMDTQTYEALYYRARLILGDSLPRPPR